MKLEKKFEFKYQGENFIDLNTLITSQFHFLAAVNEIQKELYPEVDLKIKVGAFNEGSFAIDLLMESSWIDHLFNKDNLDILGGIVGAFASIIGIHEFLKGKKADKTVEKDDSITISVDGNNNQITVDKRVFNIYRDNVTVNKAIQQNFELLSNDTEIQGVEIKDEKKELVKIPKESFEGLSSHNPYLDRPTLEEVHARQNLFIKKANVMPDGRVWKWGFIHRGRDITANVKDREFERRINEGLRIGQGDRLVADLKIGLKYSEQFATYIERGYYEVVKVHDIIPRSDQTKIDY